MSTAATSLASKYNQNEKYIFTTSQSPSYQNLIQASTKKSPAYHRKGIKSQFHDKYTFTPRPSIDSYKQYSGHYTSWATKHYQKSHHNQNHHTKHTHATGNTEQNLKTHKRDYQNKIQNMQAQRRNHLVKATPKVRPEEKFGTLYVPVEVDCGPGKQPVSSSNFPNMNSGISDEFSQSLSMRSGDHWGPPTDVAQGPGVLEMLLTPIIAMFDMLLSPIISILEMIITPFVMILEPIFTGLMMIVMIIPNLITDVLGSMFDLSKLEPMLPQLLIFVLPLLLPIILNPDNFSSLDFSLDDFMLTGFDTDNLLKLRENLHDNHVEAKIVKDFLETLKDLKV